MKERPVSRTPWCVVIYGVNNASLDQVVSRHRWRWVADIGAWFQRGTVRALRKLGHRRSGVEVRWLP